ncbi:hypothetical protein SAMN05421664_0218 [Chryseobacterium soldanellicola]|uniref:DUF3298 domain-containing protein n=1 Tax=Chryseobacterium soldanellicola TaxID=311333 RepID=A0A1H0XS84_9FLAO|nr:DUF3298 domain-containing protein [Chryseobacterium soldanellicola]SDQ05787.1 hypothetical protein SAMN05421664_0218 [Chryseobacterium soldanellicola]
MKNYIRIISICSLFLIFSCKKSENKKLSNKENFTIDSIGIHESVKVFDSVTMKYSSKLLIFPTLKDKKLLDSIYFDKKGMTDFSKSQMINFLKKEKEEYYDFVKKEKKNADIYYAQTWENYSDMRIKSLKNDYLQIQYYKKTIDGGAHGRYNYFERAFDIKDNKKLQLKDITLISKEKLSEILKKNFDNNKKGLKFSDLTIQSISPNKNFYFDEKNLYFHYNLDVFMPGYPMGDIVVPASWQDLKGTLNPEFKERMKIN